MKNLSLHIAWAIVAAALAAGVSLASRRMPPEPAPTADGKTSAALRARVAELEAELAERRAPATERPAAPKIAEPAADAPVAAALSVEQLRVLLRGNREEQA